MNQYSLIIVMLCIYTNQSFPSDMNYTERDACIQKLLSRGYIVEDLSDAVTGYNETEKGKQLCMDTAEHFYNLRN